MTLKKFCKGQPPVNSASYMRKKIKSVMKMCSIITYKYIELSNYSKATDSYLSNYISEAKVPSLLQEMTIK